MDRTEKRAPMTTHTVPTRERCQLIDVTEIVRETARQQKLNTGMVIVYVPHTTAAVTINENADPDVQHDLLEKLDMLVPLRESYYHHAEGNSDSHVKTSLLGSSVTVLVENGRLVLGQWQGIYFCEFDGPRQRQMMVKTVAFDRAD
jgi:secondary thiamine-phosphate synthase enzyme